jgi:hypothetical protein
MADVQEPSATAHRAEIEARLDQALNDTFPCSDPIAVSCLAELEARSDECEEGAQSAPRSGASRSPKTAITPGDWWAILDSNQ